MNDTKTIEAGGLVMNPSEQTVIYQGREIELSVREFRLLYHLMTNQGKVFSKEQIYAFYRSGKNCENYHRVEVEISRLRKKLGRRSDGSHFIVTVRERGYKFKG